jgi:CubicO group peptidase (beta-lactamase class C family)
LGSPLDLLADWPVANAAAAVVGPEGVRQTYGDLDRPFWLASVTKPLFATAVLVAIEEESLTLDQPAGPEGSTVAHLLSHASGLGLDGGSIAKPGRRRIYSNAGFNLLGQTLGGACAMAPATYLAEAVLDPLGMTATALDGSPASGATSTVADLTRWVGELLAPSLLAASTVDLARTVAFPGLDGLVPGYGKQSPNDWGLGFEIKGGKDPHWTAPDGDPATFGHFGRSGTFVWIDPSVPVGLIVLTDREFESWAKPLWPAVSTAVLASAA